MCMPQYFIYGKSRNNAKSFGVFGVPSPVTGSYFKKISHGHYFGLGILWSLPILELP